jgi:hypothetical protein
MPVPVAHLGGPARRVNNVGEQHRGQHPITGHLGLLAGEERGDFLEGRTPSRFDEVENVAPRKLNVFRTRYAISDVLAPLGRDQRVVGVMEDECRRRVAVIRRNSALFGESPRAPDRRFPRLPRMAADPVTPACPCSRPVRRSYTGHPRRCQRYADK